MDRRPDPLPPCRPAWALALCVLLSAVCARRARGDAVVLLWDRGADARASAPTDAALTLHLAERFAARGDALKVVAVGARPNGKPRLLDLSLPLTVATLAEAGAREGFAHDGPTDARAALAAALRGSTPREPLTLVLVGPYGRVDPTPEGTAFALETWNRTAPSGSRLLPLSLSAAAAGLLAGARGYQASGTLVLAAGPLSAAPRPWSAFGGEAVLEAELSLPLELLAWAPAGAASPAPPAPLAQGGPDDVLTPLPAPPGERRYRLEHPLVQGLATSVRLSAPPTSDGGAALWLVPEPEPVAVTWPAPAPELRWLPEGSGAPALEAADLERGVPRETRARYRRTCAAAPTGWITVVERADPQGPAPTELAARVEGERRLSPFLVEGELHLRATPGEPRPGRARGTLALEPEGDGAGPALRMAYDLGYAPGRVRVRLQAEGGPRRLPAAASERPFTLTLSAENGNAPPALGLVWRSGLPADEQERVTLRLSRGEAEPATWRAGERRDLPLGATFELRPVLEREADPRLPGRLLRPAPPAWLRCEPLAAEGVEVVVEGEGLLEPRRPRHVAEPADPLYRLGADDARDERRLRLTLDPDGCEGPWLADLLSAAPSVRLAREGPQAFEVAPVGPGRYEVRRQGGWKGGRADPFADREERLGPLHGVGAQGPLDPVELRLLVPARWGRLGYVLAALAGLAVVLLVAVLRAHRVPPAAGTLLYTVEGREGAVGRLPLAGAGRRATPVTLDGAGRLALGGGGPVLVRLRPTRAGVLLEVPGEGRRLAERPPERRLLVDGLTLAVGRHALRYVQGDVPKEGAEPRLPSGPPGAPDLLGPEYDLPGSATPPTRPPG